MVLRAELISKFKQAAAGGRSSKFDVERSMFDVKSGSRFRSSKVLVLQP
jgi:hypothetical protein